VTDAELIRERDAERLLGLRPGTLRKRRSRASEGVPWERLADGTVAYYRTAMPDGNRSEYLCERDAERALGLARGALAHRRKRAAAGVDWHKAKGRVLYRRCDLAKMAARSGPGHLAGDLPTYSTTHKRVAALWGPASIWPCATVGCTEQAAQWAYIEGCEDQHADPTGRNAGLLHCEHPECYRALCATCHSVETREQGRQQVAR